jgi:hypothetical protein
MADGPSKIEPGSKKAAPHLEKTGRAGAAMSGITLVYCPFAEQRAGMPKAEIHDD